MMSIPRERWGFSTIGCPGWSLAQAAVFGEENGFPLLEVRIKDETFAEKEPLRRLGREKRCRILGSSFGLLTDEPGFRQKLVSCARLAAECSIPYVRIFGGCSFDEGLDNRKMENARKNLDFFDTLSLPVQLVLETHDVFSSAARVAELFRYTGRKMPVIWDTFHTYFTGGETLRESWELLADEEMDIHIKDGSLAGLTAPGKGLFPFAELGKLLEEKAYAGTICFEHEKMWHPELPELSEAIRDLKRLCQSFMEPAAQ